MKVSVIIPVYNAEKTLPRTVESVLAQTYTDYEVIMADSCSTDDSAALMRQYTEKFPNFRMVSNPAKLGAGYARNSAIREASGEYIAFLDADDAWEPQKLEKQMCLAEQHPEGRLYFTGSSYMSASGQPMNGRLDVPEAVGYEALLKQNVISCSSVLMPRKNLPESLFPTLIDCHEDYALWLSILKEGGTACAVQEPLLIYRLGNGKSANKLKAARLNWNTYGVAGLSFGKKCVSMLHYACRGIGKYSEILVKNKMVKAGKDKA